MEHAITTAGHTVDADSKPLTRNPLSTAGPPSCAQEARGRSSSNFGASMSYWRWNGFTVLGFRV